MQSTTGRSRWILYAIVAALFVAVTTMLDTWTFEHVRRPDIYDHDWGRLLRMAGYLPTWLLVSLGVAIADRTIDSTRRYLTSRAALIIYAPALAGIVGELLKIIIRRDRPEVAHGAHIFRAWSDRPLNGGGFGMPSSHAIVAFGAAEMMSRLWPRGRWLWYLIALGCAASRVLAGAHFLSDVTLAAFVGPLMAAVVWRWRRTVNGAAAG